MRRGAGPTPISILVVAEVRAGRCAGAATSTGARARRGRLSVRMQVARRACSGLCVTIGLAALWGEQISWSRRKRDPTQERRARGAAPCRAPRAERRHHRPMGRHAVKTLQRAIGAPRVPRPPPAQACYRRLTLSSPVRGVRVRLRRKGLDTFEAPSPAHDDVHAYVLMGGQFVCGISGE